MTAYSNSTPTADHRRCRRQQWLSSPIVKVPTARLGQRPGPEDLGLSLSARDEQVEQDRTSHVLPHHPELAWPTTPSRAIVVNSIGHTTTKSGLRLRNRTGPSFLPGRDRDSTDEELAAEYCTMTTTTVHGEWNYTIAPMTWDIPIVQVIS